jgi:hypothetical protein
MAVGLALAAVFTFGMTGCTTARGCTASEWASDARAASGAASALLETDRFYFRPIGVNLAV